jgi:hypothetical protein
MPNDERQSPIESGRRSEQRAKRWFRRNQSGAGWHPGSWQGWLIIGVVVAAIIVVVVLLRSGAI